jgi:DNA repair protein SbcD/Mre11
MKILHSADWHLGIRFAEDSLEREQSLFLNWLLDLIETEKVDLLIVAGDIFDSINPPNYAQKQYYDFVTKLYSQKHEPSAVIVGGNHDSPGQLNAPKQVLNFLRFYVIGNTAQEPSEQIIEITTKSGEKAIIAAVPFLRDSEIRAFKSGAGSEETAKAINEGIKKHYTTIAELAIQKKENRNIPIIATGHLYAAGASLCDSERDIHIGNLGAIESSVFSDEFAYVALGHIHSRQLVGGRDNILYSGSPLKFSFSEVNHKKSITLLEFDGDKLSNISMIEVPQHREVITIKGTFDAVLNHLMGLDVYKGDFIPFAEVRIDSDKVIPSLYQEIKSAAENKLKVIKVSYIKSNESTDIKENLLYGSSIAELAPIEVFRQLLRDKNIEEKFDEYSTGFNQLLEECLQGEASNENS